jgi:hypothetical protein
MVREPSEHVNRHHGDVQGASRAMLMSNLAADPYAAVLEQQARDE